MSGGNYPLSGVDVDLHRVVAIGDTALVVIQFACHRDRNLAAFHTVVQPRGAAASWGSDPLVIAVADLAPPRRWEFRTSGLWAEQVCERRDVHWSYGLEAFALQIDRPDELVRRGYGLRTALGWELDLEIESSTPTEGLVVQHGTIDGLLLIGTDEFPISGPARRIHGWGQTETLDRIGWRTETTTTPTESTMEVLLPTPAGIWTVSLPG